MKLVSAEQWKEMHPESDVFELMRTYADHWSYWLNEFRLGRAFQCVCGDITKNQICNECKSKTMRTLHLNLKRKWFDMILSGIKTEEYREIKPHWAKQLFVMSEFYHVFGREPTMNEILIDYCNDIQKHGNYGTSELKRFNKFDTITFSNGYAKDRDQFVIECKGVEISEGKPEWGAEPGEKYFVIKLGKILSMDVKYKTYEKRVL